VTLGQYEGTVRIARRVFRVLPSAALFLDQNRVGPRSVRHPG
jgi:hypothetical protein